MTAVREVTELITDGPAQALAGLLGVPEPAGAGEGLPLLWHWVYLLDRPPQAALGPDGHPAVGAIPAPPGPGMRRMFAGGRVRQHGPLRTGETATRRAWQASSTVKQGRSGPLHFITVRTEIRQAGQVVITEEQDLVYRQPIRPTGGLVQEPGGPAQAPGGPGQAAGPPGQAAGAEQPGGTRDWPVEVNPVLLFRFSALTYNAHRIHYDRAYAQDVEGYPGLVVHGPLQALLMAELARREAARPALRDYSYRLVAPLFDKQGLIVSVTPEGPVYMVRTSDSAGRTTASGVIKPASDLTD